MMNPKVIDTLLAMLRNPPKSNAAGNALLKQDTQERITRMDKAKVLRPYFLPVLTENQNYSILLDGQAGSVATRYTPANTSPMLITAAISDMDAEKIRLSDTIYSRAWSDYAVPARAVAGVRPGLVGLNGYRDFEEPIILEAQNQMSLDVVNVAGANTRRWFVFEAFRVAPLRDVSLEVYEEADRLALNNIKNGIPPRNFDIQLDVPLLGAGSPNQLLENLATKAYGLPLLVYGVTTTLKNSYVRIRDSSDNNWSPAPVPVWAMASHNAQASGRPVMRFKRPFYIGGGMEVRVDVQNTADPTQAADVAGSLTFKCATP